VLLDHDSVMRWDFYGPKTAGNSRDGLFSHLHLQPVLDLALKSYPSALREQAGPGASN